MYHVSHNGGYVDVAWKLVYIRKKNATEHG